MQIVREIALIIGRLWNWQLVTGKRNGVELNHFVNFRVINLAGRHQTTDFFNAGLCIIFLLLEMIHRFTHA